MADESPTGVTDVENGKVDLTKPILPQVAALEDGYWEWIHDAVPPNTAKKLRGDRTAKWAGSLRMFESDLMESMSHIPWWLVLVVWVPIVAALLLVATLGEADLALGLPLAAAGAWFALGLFLWTFTEYVLHRFAFHYRPRSAFGRRLHFLAHGIHHLDPWDGTRLVFPPVAGLLIAAAIFGLVRLALPLAPAMATMAGLLTGYIAYDMTHYYTHHGRPRNRVGKYLKRYHLAHHHKEPERLFGVSNPLWDLVFRTGIRKAAAPDSTPRKS